MGENERCLKEAEFRSLWEEINRGREQDASQRESHARSTERLAVVAERLAEATEEVRKLVHGNGQLGLRAWQREMELWRSETRKWMELRESRERAADAAAERRMEELRRERRSFCWRVLLYGVTAGLGGMWAWWLRR